MRYAYQFKDKDVAWQTYRMVKQYYNQNSRNVIRLKNSTIILDSDDLGRLEGMIQRFNASCKKRRINSAVSA